MLDDAQPDYIRGHGPLLHGSLLAWVWICRSSVGLSAAKPEMELSFSVIFRVRKVRGPHANVSALDVLQHQRGLTVLALEISIGFESYLSEGCIQTGLVQGIANILGCR